MPATPALPVRTQIPVGILEVVLEFRESELRSARKLQLSSFCSATSIAPHHSRPPVDLHRDLPRGLRPTPERYKLHLSLLLNYFDATSTLPDEGLTTAAGSRQQPASRWRTMCEWVQAQAGGRASLRRFGGAWGLKLIEWSRHTKPRPFFTRGDSAPP
eukprot:COSAG06_NODE_1343_length_9787_cov_18.972853_2_plen_158_part_00